MTEVFGEAWSPMSVPDLAPDDDDDSPSIDIFFPSSMERKRPLLCLSVAAAFALSGL